MTTTSCAVDKDLLELSNEHKTVRNLHMSSNDHTELSARVNHLAYILTSSGLASIYLETHGFIDMEQLRKSIRWHGSLIKILQEKGRGFYVTFRRDKTILTGRLSTQIDIYNGLVGRLLEVTQGVMTTMDKLNHVLKDIPEED